MAMARKEKTNNNMIQTHDIIGRYCSYDLNHLIFREVGVHIPAAGRRRPKGPPICAPILLRQSKHTDSSQARLPIVKGCEIPFGSPTRIHHPTTPTKNNKVMSDSSSCECGWRLRRYHQTSLFVQTISSNDTSRQ